MDLNLIRAIRGDGSLDTLFLFITNLGSELGYIVILTAVYLLAPRLGRQIGLWFGVNVALNNAIKLGFDLPRPYTLDAALSTDAARATAGGPGLPSGHAQSAIFVWGSLAMYAMRPWLWVVSVAVIALVAFSRMYLGVHFLDDVLLGLALGAFVAWLAFLIRVPRVNGLTAFGLLVALVGLCGLLTEVWGREFGVLWGFFAASANFRQPRGIAARVGFVLGGLVLALGLYVASSVLLPEEWKRSAIGGLLRYAALTLTIAELYPRFALRFLPRDTTSPDTR
jgi:PAP2 superfamily